MRVAIVGFGVEGASALKYYSQLGAEVTVCDENPATVVPGGVATQLGDNYLDNLTGFDVVVRSAGINPYIILAKNPGIEARITTIINEFFRVSPTKNIIGITGTKGKGTTSTLIAKMLEAGSQQVFLGGNIGASPLEFLPRLSQNSWVVLELSSFQLVDLNYSPRIALCLMVVPEHLNWHKDMDDYILAKSRLFEHQTAADTAIYYAGSDDSRRIAGYSSGLKIPYFIAPGALVKQNQIVIANIPVCDVSELKLLGGHNWQNVCAAVTTVWQISQNVEAMRSVLTSFSGLPHRLELVRELDGVKYYDDSFGTTPETAIVAMKAFPGPKVLILGGSDKGVEFDNLARVVRRSNVRKAILIGDTAPKIQAALEKANFTDVVLGKTAMPEILAAVRAAVKPGDVVLLSTGCASFGLFQNYKDRAEQFKRAVNAL